MDRNFGDAHYTSAFVQDRIQGMAGQELYRTRNGKRERVARVVFWDASGQFSVEAFNGDVPLDLLEELTGEARRTIETQ